MNETRDGEDAAGMLEGCDLAITNRPYDNNMSIFRPVYTQYEFDIDHSADYTKDSLKKKIHHQFRSMKQKYCQTEYLRHFCFGKLPFIPILKKYKWKQWLLVDFIAGLIVGIMNIPQGMAYAQLTGLKPVYGLYVSFFPVIIYYFFGTSKHISIGTIAIVSLLTGNFLEKSMLDQPLSDTVNTTKTGIPFYSVKQSLEMGNRVAGFTFLVGITQLLMGIFNLGILTRYLSDPVVSGFAVGSSVHVLTSQLKYCFGVKIPKFHGLFNVIKIVIAIGKEIPNTNIPTIVMTLISMAILFVTKEFINPRVVKKIRVPIPMELLVVIAGTLASTYLNLNSKNNVLIVGDISRGLPAPSIPRIAAASGYISDIIITAIIAFSISVSLGKIFAKKHGYKINASQEFLAYGQMNIFSSFFSCYPSAASLSRSAVQESVGGKTQLTSIFSASLILLVLLFIGPLFQQLPNCILASIIIVALKGMFMQFAELKELWLFSIWDFNIWIATFLGAAFLDVEYGLIIGVSLSILSIMLRTQNPKCHLLGQIMGTDIYKNIDVYKQSREIPGIKIFRFEGSLFYACSDNFRKSLYAKTECDPRLIKTQLLKIERKINKAQKVIERNEQNPELQLQLNFLQKEREIMNNRNIDHIIIDCSTWGYIDIVGVKVLNQVIEEYNSVKVSVSLANPKTDIRKMFNRIQTGDHIDDKIIYVSVHDAVINSLYKSKSVEHTFN